MTSVFEENGDIVRISEISSPLIEEGNAILPLSGGGFVVGGLTVNANGDTDGLLVFGNNDGEIEFTKILPSNQFEYFQELVLLASGEFVGVGLYERAG